MIMYIMYQLCNLCSLYSVKEECPISDFKPISKTFDHNGGTLIIKEHNVTITVPALAVSEGDKVEVQAAASLIGPYKLPDDCSPISVFVWMGANYMFKKPIRIRIPHFASVTDSNDAFGVVVLTADKKDLVLNENGDLVLQMHESVCDYQYEVNDDYCDYYTNHFCSKCLARRSTFYYYMYKLYSWLTLCKPIKTKLAVCFCLPLDYETADKILLELCICYRIDHCLEVSEVL